MVLCFMLLLLTFSVYSVLAIRDSLMLFSVFLFLYTLCGVYSYVHLVLFPSLLIPGVSLSAISLVLDYLEMT